MKKIAVLGCIGFVLLSVAALLTVLNPMDSNVVRLVAVALWPISIGLITVSVLFLLRDSRRTTRKLRREIRALATTGSRPKAKVEKPNKLSPSQAWAYKEALEALQSELPVSRCSHHFSFSFASVVIAARRPEIFSPYFSSISHGDMTRDDVAKHDGLFVVLDEEISLSNVSYLIHASVELSVPIIVYLDGSPPAIPDIQLARYATAVFHPDVDVLEKLMEELGHDRVYLGDLGVDTSLANPVGSKRHRLRRGLYAGANWWEDTEQLRDRDVLLEELASGGFLSIADSSWSQSSSFPKNLAASAFPGEEFDAVLSMHKLFEYSVYIASNKESASDVGRQILHLQALGIPVLSNYAVSVFNRLPSVRIVAERMDLSQLFTRGALRDSDAIAQVAASEVITAQNRFSSINSMLVRVGMEPIRHRPESILVLARGNFQKIQKVVSRQNFANVTVIPESQLATISLDRFGYVAVMSDEYNYGSDYLRGRLAAFMYTDAHIITQENGFIGGSYKPGRVHEYATAEIQPELSLLSTDHPDIDMFLSGVRSHEKFECYLVDHYQVDYNLYLNNQYEPCAGGKKLLSVIVPIHNNGKYLLNKAIPSLKLNTLFRDMEILLVDDGSDDESTIAICEELAATYPQISYFGFNDGGSGSASRPRNYGMGEAKAGLVTFLDPDNEISIGGYDRLVEHYNAEVTKNPNVEFVSGFQAKVAVRRAYTGKHARTDLEVVDDFYGKFFSNGEFPVISTQAAVISKSFFERTKLQFVERAVGQDTLFGWELILNARAGVFVKDSFLLYYAERGDSVTNVVGAKYFARVLINERAKYQALREHELVDVYVDTHMPRFIRTWYLPRLERVPGEQYSVARADLEAIVSLYGRSLSDYED